MTGRRITPVILCGGAGTRLWPASQDDLPKPFLPLVEGASTFDGTLKRVADPEQFAPPIIIANRRHGPVLDAALKAAGHAATVLLEPVPRDTAAAIAAGAAFAVASDPEALLLVLAADHLIRDIAGFRATVAQASPAALAGRIVVFGVTPDRPATGYGYIRPGAPLGGMDGIAEVAAFVEKPDLATAAAYVAAGYLWNSGNFMLTGATALGEIDAFAPEIAAAARAAVAGITPADGQHLLAAEAFAAAPKQSIDYAVMEKTAKAVVVAARFDWSDLGTWSAIYDASPKDAAGNATAGDTVLINSRGALVISDRPLIGAIGIDDLVIVAGNGAVLVAPRQRADEVKQLAEAVAKDPRFDDAGALLVHHPWGAHQPLDRGPRHRVTRIVVNPGARLPARGHPASSQHWTVVGGEAEIAVGKETIRLAENQSITIPSGTTHGAANPGPAPLIIIAVEFGDELGEDDSRR